MQLLTTAIYMSITQEHSHADKKCFGQKSNLVKGFISTISTNFYNPLGLVETVLTQWKEIETDIFQ